MRIFGDKIDDAGQAITAVHRRRRAAQDFNALIQIGIGVGAASGEHRALAERARQGNAVFQQHHAIAVKAANTNAFIAATPHGGRGARHTANTIDRAAHFHTRLVAQGILDVLGVLLLDFFRGNHRYGGGDTIEIGVYATCGNNGNVVQWPALRQQLRRGLWRLLCQCRHDSPLLQYDGRSQREFLFAETHSNHSLSGLGYWRLRWLPELL